MPGQRGARALHPHLGSSRSRARPRAVIDEVERLGMIALWRCNI